MTNDDTGSVSSVAALIESTFLSDKGTQDTPADVTEEDKLLDEVLEEAENEESPEDGEDSDQEENQTYEVTVNGHKIQVPLNELIKGYSREADYTKKTTALAEQRKEIESVKSVKEAEIAEVTAKKIALVNKLSEVEKILEAESDIDWGRLAKDNPDRYVALKFEDDQRKAALKVAGAEKQRIQEELHHQQQESYQKHLEAERQKLIEIIPEFGDAEKATKRWEELDNFLVKEKFTAAEVQGLLNHKSLLLVIDAMKYRNLQSKASDIRDKKINTSPKTLKGGTGGDNVQTKSQSYKTSFEKARNTGRVDDIAALLLQKMTK